MPSKKYFIGVLHEGAWPEPTAPARDFQTSNLINNARDYDVTVKKPSPQTVQPVMVPTQSMRVNAMTATSNPVYSLQVDRFRDVNNNQSYNNAIQPTPLNMAQSEMISSSKKCKMRFS
eukprot:TRINITY_DN1143_c0_g1_i10.p2 TRINITY_DN1143_c0_g1~~TRINITY_DN1143_c0_g1_i10.p2  ORF type:complete len:118 (-),score=6.13 TRINITY_DN1143_c0_g1_i10:540-893(-)